MIKVLFLVENLGGGGAERVLVNLVNHMDLTRYDITIQTMFSGGVNLLLLDSNITYKCKKALCFRGVSYIYKFISEKILYNYFIGKDKYDIVIAYMHGLPVKVLAGCRDKNIKKLAWIHFGNPKSKIIVRPWLNKNKAFAAYSSFNRVIGVSESVANAFQKYTNIPTKAIYNTYDIDRVRLLAQQDVQLPFEKKRFLICTAGRLTSQKGYDRLINVTVKMWEEEYRFDLAIMGIGAEESKLKNLVKEHNAEEYIHFLGFCDNPYAIMHQSDLYVLSSREEGLATVIVEALTVGLPVVATDVSGTIETLGENNEYGIVVDNSEEGIYQGLKQMMGDEALCHHYAEKAKERSEFFSTEKTVGAVENLIEEVLKE